MRHLPLHAAVLGVQVGALVFASAPLLVHAIFLSMVNTARVVRPICTGLGTLMPTGGTER